MKHFANLTGNVDGFKKLAFGPRIKSMMDRVRSLPEMRIATVEEAKAAVAVARQSVNGLMADATLERLLAHNPMVVQLVKGEGIPADKTVFNAVYPLTEAGAEALLEGRFRGNDPDLSFIARPNEHPVALYGALMFTPAAFGPAMKALTYQIGGMAPEGCPLFSRPTTPHTIRLFPEMGFLPACEIYPGAPDGLMVILPEAEISPRELDEKRMPQVAPPASPTPSRPARTLTVRVARTMEDMMKVFSIRAATYMSEQMCPYDEEFDGNDFCSMHLLGEIDGEPVGCLRMRFFGGFVKIERLAVRTEFRSTKMAFRLVRAGVEVCRQKGYAKLYGHSRADLTRFWSVFGFREIAERPRFSFSGVDYVEMQADIAPHAEPVAIGADPFVLIRPEGEWNTPGPLDRSRERVLEPEVAERMRTVGGARVR